MQITPSSLSLLSPLSLSTMASSALRRAVSTLANSAHVSGCQLPPPPVAPLARALSTAPPGGRQQDEDELTARAAADILRRLTPSEPPPVTRNALIDNLNAALTRFPLTTSTWYLYHQPVYVGAVFGVYTLAGFTPHVDLGLAFLLNGGLKRLRVPVIAGLSAGVVRAFPSLAQLKVSRLLAAPFAGLVPASSSTAAEATQPPQHAPASKLAATASGASSGGASTPQSSSPSFASTLKDKLLHWFNPFGGALAALMDRFGLAYVLTARVVASANLLAIYAALRYGVDVAPLLEWLGSTGEAASGYVARWAASALTLNAVYPAALHWGVSAVALRAGPTVEPKLLRMAAETAVAAGEAAQAWREAKTAREGARTGTRDI